MYARMVHHRFSLASYGHLNLRFTKYELKYALDLDWFLGLTISHVTLSCSQFLYEKYNLYTIFISFRYVKKTEQRLDAFKELF